MYLFSFSDDAFSGATLEATLGANYTGPKDMDLDLLATDNFGSAVALDGNRLAVGARQGDGDSDAASASGEVYLFTFSDSTFSGGALQGMIGKGYAGAKDINVSNVTAGDQLGYSVAMDGNRLVAGAYFDDGLNDPGTNSGAAYLFDFSDSAFSGGTLRGTVGYGYADDKSINLSAVASNDYFGQSVSLDGNRLAVGAVFGDGYNGPTNSGVVHLFTFDDADYANARLTSLIGNGYTGGKNIDVTLDTSDSFGSAVSLDGNRLAVGSYLDSGNGNSVTNSGAVYLFSFSDSEFSGGTLEATLGNGYTTGKDINLTQLTTNDQFGYSLSLDGNRLAVGANYGDGSTNALTNSGEVYLFSFSDSSFSGGTLEATLGNGYSGGKNYDVLQLTAVDYFGSSVSLDGNRLAVGASGGDGDSNSRVNSGEVYLFSFSDSGFSAPTHAATVGYGYNTGNDIDVSALNNSDGFGEGVALEGTTLAVGAIGDDGFGGGLSGAGAVHLFTFSDTAFSSGSHTSTIGHGYTGGSNIDLSSNMSNINEAFGKGVSLDGGRLAVGAYFDDGVGDEEANSGAVYLFRATSSSDPLSDATAYATRQGDNVTITPDSLTAILNAGTNVTLLANNDIAVNNAILVNNGSGNGGALTFQAGRSILVNANITTDNGNVNLYANEKLSTGVVDAERDAGAAEITMAAGTTIDAGTGTVTIRLDDGAGKTNATAGDITLRTINAASIFARNHNATGDIILPGGAALTASGAGDLVTLVSARNILNQAGAGALNVSGGGRWLLYSTNPTDTTGEDTLSNAFNRYSCTYAGACPTLGSGNGLLYSYTPVIDVAITDTNYAYGDAVGAPSGYTVTTGDYLNALDQAGDSLSGSVTLQTNYVQGNNAGSAYAISNNGSTLASALGYGFNYVTTNGTVAQRAVTIRANNQTQTYGFGSLGTTAYTITSGSLYNTDALSGVTLGTNATTSTSGEYQYAATPWTITSSAAAFSSGAGTNYSITYQNAPTGLTINRRALSISSFTADNKVYDANTSAAVSAYTFDNAVGGDALSVSGIAGLFNSQNAGTRTASLNNGTLAGADANNYSFTLGAATDDADITARGVTVSATAQNKTYGDADPALSYSYSALATGDTAGIFSGGLTRAAGENAGLYAINQGTLSAGGNYTISYNGANLTINKALLTITANNATRLFGEVNPGFTASYAGFIPGDTSAAISGLNLSSVAGGASPAGNYAITGSGATALNYSMAYVNGVLTVTGSAPASPTAPTTPLTVIPHTVEITSQIPQPQFAMSRGWASPFVASQPMMMPATPPSAPSTVTPNANAPAPKSNEPLKEDAAAKLSPANQTPYYFASHDSMLWFAPDVLPLAPALPHTDE